MANTVSDKRNKYDLWHLFFTYKGRINRQQYIVGWAILLCSYFPLLILTEFIDQFIPLEVFRILPHVALIGVLVVPHVFIMIKRLHDFNTSGFFILFLLLPILGWFIAMPIAVLLSMSINGSTHDNKYGLDPNLTRLQYCNQCGNPIKSQVAFCPSCGKSLTPDSER